MGVPNQQQQPQSNVNVMTNVIVDKIGNFDNVSCMKEEREDTMIQGGGGSSGNNNNSNISNQKSPHELASARRRGKNATRNWQIWQRYYGWGGNSIPPLHLPNNHLFIESGWSI